MTEKLHAESVKLYKMEDKEEGLVVRRNCNL
jgi:hypothetical protein